MLLEPELPFQRIEHQFDPLHERFQELRVLPHGFSFYERVGEAAEAFAVAGLLRDRGGRDVQVGVSPSDPAAFVVVRVQRLHDGEDDQFRVADPGRESDSWPPRSQVGFAFR